ncbi:radical SAM family heme chaperone HemW [Aestuariivita sp.]|uniref:radical SAM family heme chaperone HemW n=1 Tax=Aestuariivita sp. TaxID=1872407 RepID=UPI0021700F30|nr:radical SAM family heme chaperone HemW [Aestuariivita sp.]MCE8005509.1 coproporphyrinogen III oxidase [Aestuariivita sp.]
MTEDWQNGGFGLYIHWPFCQAKCPYCDFNSHVVRDIDQSRWVRAYIRELDRVAAELPNRILNTIFFGGGTPSLMAPETVAAILDHVKQLWPMANAPEITLEANPGSVEAGKFRGFRDAGVNRISMGIQALNDRDLQRLGRIHSAAEAMAAFDLARSLFDRVSFDLIYARQDQTVQAWEAELKQALTLAIDHLSLYQLTIEDGTAFGDRYALGKLRGLPDDDSAADMYDVTQNLCAQAGMLNYEVSNHAHPGAESRHNLIYWRYGDYAGIGPGAHGRITVDGTRYATECTRMPGAWLHAAERGGAETVREPVSPKDQAREYLLMGMRVRDGIDRARYQRMSGQDFNPQTVEHLVDLGMINATLDRLSVTNQGLMILNTIITELAAD